MTTGADANAELIDNMHQAESKVQATHAIPSLAMTIKYRQGTMTGSEARLQEICLVRSLHSAAPQDWHSWAELGCPAQQHSRCS